jgi:hypothetical protein
MPNKEENRAYLIAIGVVFAASWAFIKAFS